MIRGFQSAQKEIKPEIKKDFKDRRKKLNDRILEVNKKQESISDKVYLEKGGKYYRRKINPDYNSETAYINREDRKEWDVVGLMGKLRIKKGQQTGTNWIKMRDISDAVEEWLVR